MPPEGTTHGSGWIAAAPQHFAASGPRFGFADFTRVVAERAGAIRFISVGVIAITFLVLVAMPTLYSSSAVIMIEQRKNNVTDQSSVLSELPTDQASLQNQIQILTSRELASSVIAKLRLDRDPEFRAGGTGLWASIFAWFGLAAPDGASRYGDLSPAEADEVIDRFRASESVDTLGMSTTITVTFTARDPEKAALIANTIADAYIAYQLRVKNDATRETTQWLNDRIHQLSVQVQAAESATQKYKAENNLNEAADGTPLTDQQLIAINAQIVQARSDLAQKQATYSRIRALVDSGHAADVTQVVASPLIVQLRTQQADLVRQEADMATRYGPKHPKLIALRTQRRDLEAKIDQEVSRVAGSMESDVEVARAQLLSLEQSLKQAETVAAGQNMKRVKLKALQANATSTRTMYEAFVTRLRETQDSILMSDVRVISRAPVPDGPSSPHRTLILGAAIPAGFLLGLLYALMAERFSGSGANYGPRKLPSMRTAAPLPASRPIADIDPFRGAAVLAELPDAVPVKSADYVLDWPRSAYTHAIANLLHQVTSQARRPRMLAVTSAESGEGTTSVAVSLARAAALSGLRVVLLDGNFANPADAQVLGLGSIPAGIMEALSGARPLSQCLVKDPRSGVLLLAPSAPVANCTSMVSSPVMAQLITHLKQACDLVILDAPPVLSAGAERGLLRSAETVMMVVRDGPVRASVGYALGGLASMGAPAAGVILAR